MNEGKLAWAAFKKMMQEAVRSPSPLQPSLLNGKRHNRINCKISDQPVRWPRR